MKNFHLLFCSCDHHSPNRVKNIKTTLGISIIFCNCHSHFHYFYIMGTLHMLGSLQQTLVSYKSSQMCVPILGISKMCSFKFMPLTIFSNFLRLAMLRWPNLWCQSVAPSFKDFLTFVLSYRTLTLRRYKFFSLCAFTTIVPWTLLTL